MSIWNWNNLTSSPQPEVTYAMPLILRMEKGAMPTHEDTLTATVKAVANLLDNAIIHKSKHFRRAVEMWSQGDMRKVARRARGQRWKDATNMPGVIATSGTAEVYASIPYDVEHTPVPISRLQVSGLQCTTQTKTDSKLSLHGVTLNIAVNPKVKMSTGKQMAQVGHIVHLAALQYDTKTLREWQEGNFAVQLVNFHENMPIQIKDAGFTEVEPGTLTAVGGFNI